MKRFAPWIFFSSLALVLISLDCVGEPLIERLIDACGLAVTPLDFRWDRFLARLVVLAAIMTAAAAGIPPGLAARAGYHRWRRHRWRTRRRRLRARSAGR
jgi:hypothetical protein